MSWQDEVREMAKENSLKDLRGLVQLACVQYSGMKLNNSCEEDMDKIKQIIKIYNLEIQLQENKRSFNVF